MCRVRNLPILRAQSEESTGESSSRKQVVERRRGDPFLAAIRGDSETRKTVDNSFGATLPLVSRKEYSPNETNFTLLRDRAPRPRNCGQSPSFNLSLPINWRHYRPRRQNFRPAARISTPEPSPSKALFRCCTEINGIYISLDYPRGIVR